MKTDDKIQSRIFNIHYNYSEYEPTLNYSVT